MTSCRRFWPWSGGKGAEDHPFDGKNVWETLGEGVLCPHEDILIDVEAFRGAIRKGDWKLVRVAQLPGKTDLYNLAMTRRRRTVSRRRTRSRTRFGGPAGGLRPQLKLSEWIKAQPGFLGRRARLLDPDFDIDDGGMPHEKPLLPKPMIGSAVFERCDLERLSAYALPLAIARSAMVAIL